MTREEAIDLLDNIIGFIEDNQGNDYDAAFKMAIEALKAEPCEDAISRQMAIDALDAACVKYNISPHYDDKRSDKEKFFDWWDMYKVLSMKILNNLPSVQTEIIRCRDCKFAHITNDRRYCKLCDMFTYDYGQLIEMYFDSNFYCGYAGRRTDEQTKKGCHYHNIQRFGSDC